MARKRKISELPLCTDFHGLRTIGTDKDNNSVAVSLDYIQETVEGMQTATKNANDAAQAANEAAQNALNKANSAHTAAGNANNQAAAASAAAQAVNAVVAQAESAVEDAQEAAEECRQVIASASQVESLGLIPTAMSVEYPDTITLGNPSDRYIKPIFTPSHVIPNVIYLGDDKAVSVAPNGRITVNDEGESVVHVVPTNKTALYKTIRIKVKRAGLRLVNARTSLRLTANRNLRLN